MPTLYKVPIKGCHILYICVSVISPIMMLHIKIVKLVAVVVVVAVAAIVWPLLERLKVIDKKNRPYIHTLNTPSLYGLWWLLPLLLIFEQNTSRSWPELGSLYIYIEMVPNFTANRCLYFAIYQLQSSWCNLGCGYPLPFKLSLWPLSICNTLFGLWYSLQKVPCVLYVYTWE